jgi:eukaryotic-like serine/threonine-protein kinase
MKQQAGDLAGAEADFARAEAQALRTARLDARIAWAPAANRARTAHLAGDLERAHELFAAVLKRLPAAASPGAAPEDLQALIVWEYWGERLAAEGRAEQAMPFLQAVVQRWQTQAPHDFALRRAQRHLADALARQGRHAEALALLRQSLDDFERAGHTGSQAYAATLERQGRVLLDSGDTPQAARAFNAALRAAATTPRWVHACLAQAGLARVALRQGDKAAARERADAALHCWQQRTGFYDVRMQTYLWRVQAASAAASGDSAAAARWRARALEQARRTDHPDSITQRQPDALVL